MLKTHAPLVSLSRLAARMLLAVAAAGALTVASPGPAQAAFAVFKRNGTQLDVQPATTQRLFVSYLNGIQTLVVEPQFAGKAADFGLIIPTPGIPDFSLDIGKDMLDSVENLVGGPESSPPMGGSGKDPQLAGQTNDNTTVVAQVLIGTYDVKVVSAPSVLDLTDWLDSHGYAWKDADRKVLDHYVGARWFFCVVKVNLDISNVTNPNGYDGVMPPLTLQFAANQITIPMKIAYTDERYIHWTILSDTLQELQLPGGVTSKVVLRLSQDDVTSDPMLGHLLAAGDVVTRFKLGLGTSDGPGDFVFEVGVNTTPSPTPDEPGAAGCSVVSSRTSGNGTALVLLGLGLGALVLRRRGARHS
jgi:hypothetical protein